MVLYSAINPVLGQGDVLTKLNHLSPNAIDR
jgi:hypothetical protein